MADGAVGFGSGLNSSCMTSRAKKVNNNNSMSTATNMRRKTRQSNRRDIHNRVRHDKRLVLMKLSRPEKRRSRNESSCFEMRQFRHC